jgi:tryptophan-rich sensory protein
MNTILATILTSLGALVLLALVGATVWFAQRYRPNGWYHDLRKPDWTPSAQLYAPLWIALYTMMAAAALMVWLRHGLAGTALALGLFVVQLALNAAWPWLFFGQKRLGAAFAEMVVLWVAVFATFVAFFVLEPWAGILLAPYFAWVSYSTALGGEIWLLNRYLRTTGFATVASANSHLTTSGESALDDAGQTTAQRWRPRGDTYHGEHSALAVKSSGAGN